MKKYILLLAFFLTLNLAAQIPVHYYDNAQGLTGYSLKTALRNIITNGHVNRGYNELYNGYVTTDSDNYYENDGTVLDMYSENPSGADPYNYTHNNNRCGSYSNEGDCYNREHLLPQSWFGSRSPMKSDIHHVVPSDGKVNGQRGHYPLADVGSATWTSRNGSKRGSCSDAGYGGTVFEPIDEFKGDIARIYFYMATRYENEIGSWEGSNASSNAVLDGSSDHVFENWYLDVLLQWHHQDPVSQRERDRNVAAYNYQGNANPFIDHPEWVDAIWNPSPDTQAPSVPNNLIATTITDNSVSLSWDAATDDRAVTAYYIFQDGNQVASVSTTSTTVNGLQALTTYSFCVKAVDAAGNVSNCSTTLQVTTVQGITYLINEDFENCSSIVFTAISEASNKDWDCIPDHGESNTGAMQINGYQEDVPSRDWLITTNTINFDDYSNERLSVYLAYTYGTTPLELLYSSNYDGGVHPSNYTWTAMPNVSISTPTNSSTTVELPLLNIDVSTVSGTVYLAFKYFSNGHPTRWNVDNFRITGDNTGAIQNLLEQSTEVFPNPLGQSKTLTLQIFNGLIVENIQLFNLSGQLLAIDYNSTTSKIDLSNAKSGMYFLKIATNKGEIVKRIIIE